MADAVNKAVVTCQVFTKPTSQAVMSESMMGI